MVHISVPRLGLRASDRARAGKRLLLVLAAIFVPIQALAFFGTGSGLALLGPIFGPWAGLLVGHYECTMGTVRPAASITLAVIAGPILGTAWLARPPLVRNVMLGATALWAAAWCSFAVLSFINASI
ncbi:MAG: hypothetical protein AAF628_32495 [Planctomycetota bacterium]